MIEDYLIFIGAENLNNINLTIAISRKLETIIRHAEDYEMNPAYDIALLKVTSPISVSLSLL